MKIQSLSVVVPNKKCINDCQFCVSKMHTDQYKNQMDDNLPFFDLYLKDYLERLEFARHNGCNTVMLTGNSEPQQNRKFLTYFGMFMQMMRDPFQWIEMQTTGAGIDRNYLRFLRNHVRISLISLSISSLSSSHNAEIIGCPKNMVPNLADLSRGIKEYDFSLRFSLNLTDEFDKFADDPEALFNCCKSLCADQVTLRVLYSSSQTTPQGQWIRDHAASPQTIQAITQHVLTHGELLGTLPYGAKKYSLNGMSVVVDADCMAKDGEKREMSEETYKYLVLQPNCKLYSQWDDPASLVF